MLCHAFERECQLPPTPLTILIREVTHRPEPPGQPYMLFVTFFYLEDCSEDGRYSAYRQYYISYARAENISICYFRLIDDSGKEAKITCQ